MTETCAQHLARLHQAIGLSTAPDLLQRRAGAVEALLPKITVLQAISAAALAAGVPIKFDDLSWLTLPVGTADPTFTPVLVDKSLACLAAACARRLMAGTNKQAVAASLAVLTTGFGAILEASIDSSLVVFAEQRLFAIQQQKFLKASNVIESAPVLTEQLAAIDAAVAAGNPAAMAAPLKTILITMQEKETTRNQAIANALGALITRQQVLEEDTQMQWWVAGGYSHGVGKQFADLPPFAAAGRAAHELSEMVAYRVAGPFAAPALLEMVLSKGENRERRKALSVQKAIEQIGLSERGEIFRRKSTTLPCPGVSPLFLAAELSLEARDAPDWLPRFERAAGFNTNFELSPIPFSLQLFRELLLWKQIPA